MKLAVLLGGTSAERDVSLSSGVAIARTLAENGHDVQAIDCAYGAKALDFMNIDVGDLVKTTPPDIERQKINLDRNIFSTIDYLIREKFDIIVFGLHGGYGENGKIQAMLELAHIPFTGSGSLASAVAMDKHFSKIIFQANHIPTPEWRYFQHKKDVTEQTTEDLGFPLVVKPNAQGSTVGLSIVESWENVCPAVDIAFEYDDNILLETYIPGRELTVAILGEQALPVVEIIPESGFYDYESKYQGGKSRYEVPANLPEDLTTAIQKTALRAYKVLGCAGYARADFRMNEKNEFYCLEVNTLPGMTSTSLVPKAAKAVGLQFHQLLEKIIKFAIKNDE